MKVKVIKDVITEDVYRQEDYIPFYSYDSDLTYFGTSMESEGKVEYVSIRTFKKATRDEITNEITTKEYEFVVSPEVWRKLGIVPEYIDNLNTELALAWDTSNDWWKRCIESDRERRKYLNASLWQRIKYVFTKVVE